MKVITQMGAVYKVTDKAYKSIMLMISTEQEFNLNKVTGAKFVGFIDQNITDMSPGDAQREWQQQ